MRGTAALLATALATALSGCLGLSDEAVEPARPAPDAERWETLSSRIAAPWPALQERDGRFRDYVVGERPGFPERYGESTLGYALIQTGLRDGSDELVTSGLRALAWVVGPSGGSPRASPFENLAVAGAYNLARQRLTRHPVFRQARPAWEAWLGRAALTRLPERSYYGNKHLVDAVAVLELLRTELRSNEPSAVLGGDRVRAEGLARTLLNETIPAVASARGVPLGDARAVVLSDPPTDPLAYHGLSLGMYARAVELLGDEARPAARAALRHAANASVALTAPDGDVAYFGRSQEQAWALPLTAAGAEAAAALGSSLPAEDDRQRAVAQRALERLRDAYGVGAQGLAIVPSLGAEPRAEGAALDRYAFATGYGGLTLMGLNWWLDTQDGARRRLGALAGDIDGGQVLSRGQSAFATVRAGDTWYAVKNSPPERLGDLRYGFGLAAVKVRSGRGWRDLMPLLPRTHGTPDSPGPVFMGKRGLAYPFGRRITVGAGGATIDGGFRNVAGEVVRPRVTFRYEPRPCGVRLSFPAREGDRFEYSVFFPDPETEPMPRVRPESVGDSERLVEYPPGTRVELEPGYSSATEPRLVRARLTLTAVDDEPLGVTVTCRR